VKIHNAKLFLIKLIKFPSNKDWPLPFSGPMEDEDSGVSENEMLKSSAFKLG
jgi:hypothetical protein